jgi:hypothetical protein
VFYWGVNLLCSPALLARNKGILVRASFVPFEKTYPVFPKRQFLQKVSSLLTQRQGSDT